MPRWFTPFVFFMVLSRPVWAGSLRLGTLFQWHRAELGQEYVGMLVLELPFDRLARPSFSREALASGAQPPKSGLVEDVSAETSPKRRAAQLPEVALLGREVVRRLVKAALQARGDLGARARLDGLSSRARASAALPELTLRAVRSSNALLRLSPTGVDAYDYTQTGGAGVTLEARATWRFDRLVFADEELRVERLRLQRERANERLVALLLKYLGAWQSAESHLLTDELSADERVTLEVAVLNAEAALDAITDGGFSAERPLLEARLAAVAAAPAVVAPGPEPARP